MKKNDIYSDKHKSAVSKINEHENSKNIKILFEDQFLIVIEKPAGLLSVSYPGNHSKTTVAILEQLMRRTGTYSPVHKPYPVHRLDKETSGVMMFALTKAARKIIMDNWNKMVTERLYCAVAENPSSRFELAEKGLIEDSLASNAYNISYVPLKNKTGNRNIKTVPARTRYRILKRGKTHTLFELSLDTGKKNQIRAHLAGKRYPIAGDMNYHAKTDPFGRLALHARTLGFIHPYTDKKMYFEIPEPAEWLNFVQTNVSRCAAGQQDKKKFEKKTAKAIYQYTKISRKKTTKLDFIAKGRFSGRN